MTSSSPGACCAGAAVRVSGAAEIVDIMRLLRAQTIEAGEVLVRRGDPAASMYFITAGEVEIELPAQRVQLSDGRFFGEIALLHRTQRAAR